MLIALNIRRKHIQLFLGLGFLLVITLSLSSSLYLVSENRYFTNKNFDQLGSNVYESVDESDVSAGVDARLKKLHDSKTSADLEQKFWILDTSIKHSSSLKVPNYYYNDQPKPPIQPFDPRFTLAIYYHALKVASRTKHDRVDIRLPFNWADWVDLSPLNRYLLAPSKDKPSCSILDARPEERKMNQEKKEKEEQEKKEKEEKEKEEKEKEEKEKQEENKDSEQALKREVQPENSIVEQTTNHVDQEHISKRLDSADPALFCLNNGPSGRGNKVDPGFHVFKHPSTTTPEKAILAGKSFLYSHAPPPNAIIFLTKDGAYNMTVSTVSKLLDNGLVEQYVKDTKSKTIDVLEQFNTLQSEYKAESVLVMNSYKVKIPEESFIFNHTSIMQSLEDQESLDAREKSYLQSLKYSVDAVKKGGPPKYFEEARLLQTAIGDHYDWRFFNGVMYGVYEQTLVLHRLVRVWLSFTRKHGITTWVAHGSLLSWYWNGMAFPWDNDIDVQVPIMDLHKLSLLYNQTMIVEDAEDGFGRYFLDCGTFITLREKGNGKNNIDARFIDVDTGLYIDITGMAVSNTKPPARYLKSPIDEKNENYTAINTELQLYNCRNHHFISLDEISPLVKTYIEGEIGYVPTKYSEILKVEYSKGLLSKKFERHVYLPLLRLWLKEEDLFYFLKNPKTWNNFHTYNEKYLDLPSNGTFQIDEYELTQEQKKLLHQEAKAREKAGKKGVDKSLTDLDADSLNQVFELGVDELTQLIQKDEIFAELYSTREFTSHHEQEIMRLQFKVSTAELIRKAPDFPPLKYEPFLYRNHIDLTTYESEVERYLELVSEYELDASRNNEAIY
ncbi:uncharacterized protein CANTADRAFT_299671 [Suhomyces tanzawaensis NRRL Y-17324]|uniref:LicD/FKTN/FKRP nucleotidyltransferase domain-containing protein n=1 Tax=Suhomyces tanzawaensis NRRL Y-17324 TaxID=984487 RepID=A0A1E4SFC8_9ASCO|nr:uncharacterized protein CANTADRAFT_299671 [Suhomyces tanzawaensis NRRL Y-17324]ODV78221.1 hypothetical protein CANTADRAFT_299671 [Suhomyces tanzawaensis NRRL Y-17324]